MSAQVFEQRRRADRRRTLWRVLLGVLVVAVVAGGVWLVWFSSVLGVRTVQVDGLDGLEPAAVREAAEVRRDQPLARVDLVAVASRVSAMERVERVDVTRSWPRTVRIEVVERSAVAWVRVDGAVRALDRFGVDFRTLRREPDSLVEVRTTATDARQRQLALEGAAAVLSAVRTEAPELAERVQHVEADTRDSVVLDLTKGRSVVWGSAAKGEQKLAVLGPLLEIEAAQYDVSAPEQPTTRD